MPVPDRLFAEMPEMSDSALRALLALFRLSFRFEPETSAWVKPGRAFSRSAIEAECGLSGQGARNGLQELEEAGWTSVDRSGRGHEHRLEAEVPERRFTYLPTAFFEVAPALSGTELRLTLAVLRATWGWTTSSKEHTSSTESSREEPPEHKRWARLPVSSLSAMTGRSASALRAATRSLSGDLLRRRRPGPGAYYWRLSAETLRERTLRDEANPDEAKDPADEGGRVAVSRKAQTFFSMGIPNELPPDRQQSGPPRRGYIESSSREAKQSARARGSRQPKRGKPSSEGRSAVSGNTSRSTAPDQGRETAPRRGPTEDEGTDLTGFSDKKRQLGQKLANVGVWPRRIPELLSRYTAERIEANFQLYRKRAEQVKNSGAWLAAAIEGGYALPSPTGHDSGPESPEEASADGCALPQAGAKVSEARKRSLLAEGLGEEGDFDRFARYDDPGKLQHFYRVDKGPSPAAG